MSNFENILRSPTLASRDKNADAPLRLVGGSLAALGVTALVAVVCIALWLGKVAAGTHDAGFWHVSLTFVLFWLSVTQGMVALSAILRVTHATWRYPLTRILDVASLFGVWVAVLALVYFPAARHAMYSTMTTGGAGDDFFKVWRNTGGILPPIGYDAVATVTAYLAGIVLLWLTSLPDRAAMRDGAKGTAARGHWAGAAQQWRVLRYAEGLLVVGIMATFFSAQTIIGWDFELAVGKGWDSSIFPFQYCLSALLAALAMTVLLMTGLGFKGRGLIDEAQYDSLGKFMLGLGLLWFYFRWCDYITAWFGHTPDEWVLQLQRIELSPYLFALMCVGCSVVPVFANIFRWFRRSPVLMCGQSLLILVGVACQRYLDLLPAFALRYTHDMMTAQAVGWLAFVGLGALFLLTYQIAGRFIPLVSSWGMAKSRTRRAERTLGNATVTVMVEDPPVWER